MGDLRGALDAFQRTVAVEQGLVQRDSTNLEWRRMLGNGYNTVGLTQRKLGDLAGAEKSHAAELSVKQAIAARDTANKTYREMVALAQSYVGDMLSVRGRPDEAVAPLTASRATYAALAAFDSANPERRRLLAIADRSLGVVALERGDAATAMAHASASLATIEKLAQNAPTNRAYQYVLARSLLLVSSVNLALGKTGVAELGLRRAIGIIDSGLSKRPSDLNLRIASTDTRLELGDALQRGGRLAEARASWTQALAAIDSVARTRKLTDHLALQAAALMRLDRLDEARPIVLDLVRRGYRRRRWIAIAAAKHLVPGS
jgi:tetratricopeptide (TPR) repeat protein